MCARTTHQPSNHTPNPKPQNPKAQTPNPKPQTPNIQRYFTHQIPYDAKKGANLTFALEAYCSARDRPTFGHLPIME